MYKHFFKRFFDILFSFLGLVLCLIPFLILAIAIKIDSKGPVFFTQERVGKHKKIFKIHKFRTMRVDTPHDMPTHLLKNPDEYITRVGRFLRQMSLDELPQIWDIFVGKMSMIGPRPALWNQDDLVAARDEYADKRGKTVNDLRPGLTGWAQVNGRDELEISEKAKLDGYYLQHLSLWLDIKCFFRTFTHVLTRKGVVEGGTGALADECGCAEEPPADPEDKKDDRE
ncbi:MAG: lipid carrier--UDP-N-acetylgalactosaminyltransferase [Bacillota bacterium]|nr:MAG: lipid carrier--UDP-N-acetylgalactosaminyltransferase [Bacillota bacterium]